MKNTLLQGEGTPFVMELPPYHLPTLKGIALRTWERTAGFVVRAGRVIVPMVLVINVLNSIGTTGGHGVSFGNANSERSLLAGIGRTLAPVFAPMGLTADNWPATVGIFTGVLAKEAVVGTLNATYSALATTDANLAAGVPAQEPAGKEPFDLTAALATIPANLGEALGRWGDPLGLGIGDLRDQEAAAAAVAVGTGTLGAMAARFDGAAGAFAYLLFILLYAPCVAATAAIFRETNRGWTLFAVAWTTGLGYLSATLFYQAAIFYRDPASSAAWIGGLLALFAAGLITLRRWAERDSGPARLVQESA
jgi:ferrous iron transport protein B